MTLLITTPRFEKKFQPGRFVTESVFLRWLAEAFEKYFPLLAGSKTMPLDRYVRFRLWQNVFSEGCIGNIEHFSNVSHRPDKAIPTVFIIKGGELALLSIGSAAR